MTKTTGMMLGMALTLMAAVTGKAADQAGVIRVATFNIRCPVDKTPNSWAERKERVNALIARHRFDLMGLQEATAGQIKDMLAPGWAYVGAGREDGKGGGEFSCIFYRKELFDMEENGTFWLSETPEVAGSKSWETACTRVCTWVRLRERASGKVFYHFNTHLDHKSAVARENGMALILRRIKALRDGAPVILTGDMNAVPGSVPVLKALEVLHDAATESATPRRGPEATFNGFLIDKALAVRIDYIFVTPGTRVLEHVTLDEKCGGLYPSDHFPVVAFLRL